VPQETHVEAFSELFRAAIERTSALKLPIEPRSDTDQFQALTPEHVEEIWNKLKDARRRRSDHTSPIAAACPKVTALKVFGAMAALGTVQSC
jgi:hypothetical protein